MQQVHSRIINRVRSRPNEPLALPRHLGRRLLSLGAVCSVLAAACISVASPTASGSSECTDSSRACVIAAASSYLGALVSHNGAQARLAPAAIRTENGFDTGDSGPQIASGLSTNPEYLVIKDIRDVSWFVDGDEAIAFYLIDATVPGIGTHIATSHIAERFEVEQGLITQIEAIDCTHLGTTPQPERTATIDPFVSEQCVGP